MSSIEKKKFLRLSYASKALKLEEEELHELDEIHGKQFAIDFSEENQFFVESQEKESNVVVERDESQEHDFSDSTKKIDHGSAIKKIHRALARATHPDLQEDLTEGENFKIIQEAYEAGDISTLVLKAFDLEIEVELEDKELSELEKKIENQKSSLKDIKSTLKWAWAESDKSSIVRRKIQIALGVDPAAFELWLKKKRSQEDSSNPGTSST